MTTCKLLDRGAETALLCNNAKRRYGLGIYPPSNTLAVVMPLIGDLRENLTQQRVSGNMIGARATRAGLYLFIDFPLSWRRQSGSINGKAAWPSFQRLECIPDLWMQSRATLIEMGQDGMIAFAGPRIF